MAYTGGPWPLGYHGLGDVFVMGFFGFVAVCGTAYVQLGHVPALAVWASVPVGALATAIIVVNNLRDRATDTRAGKRTLAVRLGRSATLVEYAALLAVAYAVPLGPRGAARGVARAAARDGAAGGGAAARAGGCGRRANVQRLPGGDGEAVAPARRAVRRGDRGVVRLVAVAHRRIRWELDGRGAARGVREREALLVEVRTARGARGVGEAAPLPGMSADSIEDAEQAADALAARVAGAVGDEGSGLDVGDGLDVDRGLDVGDGLDAFAALAAEVADAAPAARFAIEAALLEALAAERGQLARRRARGDRGRARAAGTGAVGRGRRCRGCAPCRREQRGRAQDRVGPGGDLERVRAIAAAAPGARLRLDANRTWPRDAVPERLAALAELPIDYVEEPCEDAHALLGDPLAVPIALDECPGGPRAVPIALDESLAALEPAALDAALAAPGLGALVLKPTLLGFAGAVELAARARAAGVPAIVTHCLESPVGRAHCAALAEAIAGSAVLAEAPALVTPSQTLTFEAVAALAPAPPHTPESHGANHDHGRDRTRTRCVIATPTPETIAAVHVALAERRPIALVHAKLPPAEQERQRAIALGAALPAGAAVVLFTSGSTGPARGVVLSRDALDAAADASARHLGWRDDDRWLLAPRSPTPAASPSSSAVSPRAAPSRSSPRAPRSPPRSRAQRSPRSSPHSSPRSSTIPLGARRRGCAPCCSAAPRPRPRCSPPRPPAACRS